MYVHKHANPARLHITRVNTSQLTWTCPRHVLGPHNFVVFTGSAGPSRQAGRQADCISEHTPVLSARRNDPHTPLGLHNVACEYYPAWPDFCSKLLKDNMVEDGASNYVLEKQRQPDLPQTFIWSMQSTLGVVDLSSVAQFKYSTSYISMYHNMYTMCWYAQFSAKKFWQVSYIKNCKLGTKNTIQL